MVRLPMVRLAHCCLYTHTEFCLARKPMVALSNMQSSVKKYLYRVNLSSTMRVFYWLEQTPPLSQLLGNFNPCPSLSRPMQMAIPLFWWKESSLPIKSLQFTTPYRFLQPLHFYENKTLTSPHPSFDENLFRWKNIFIPPPPPHLQFTTPTDFYSPPHLIKKKQKENFTLSVFTNSFTFWEHFFQGLSAWQSGLKVQVLVQVLVKINTYIVGVHYQWGQPADNLWSPDLHF